MRAYREGPGEQARRPIARAKAAPKPVRHDGPLIAAFFGTIAFMLIVNALLNAFPG